MFALNAELAFFAAHAAIYQRILMDEETETVDDVKDSAPALVNATLPTGRFGITMERSDITFGNYNTATETWTTDETSTNAVRAVARFSRGRDNAAISFLFRLIGRDDFNVAAEAIFLAYGKACLREGYVANGVVDIQSNNEFKRGFCIHSNTHVSVNQRNSYEAGTIVSMPNTDDLDILGGISYEDDGVTIDDKNFKLNEGLIEALTAGYIDLRQLPRMENLIHYYAGSRSPYGQDAPFPIVWEDSNLEYPSYINAALTTPVSIRTRSITTVEILARGTSNAVVDSAGNITQPASNGSGRVYYISCTGNSGLTIDATPKTDNNGIEIGILQNVIIISPCEIKFANGSQIRNARIITTSTSSDSMSATNGLILGAPNSCQQGVQLFSLGGMRFPSGLEVNGSQLMAKGDIKFAANANGLTGASFIAGGEIDGTSNGDMALCGTGMQNNFDISYFRMVR